MVVGGVAAVSACKGSDATSAPATQATASPSPRPTLKPFKCRKSGLEGAPWRECAPNITRCEEYGCFERDEAFCFPVKFVPLDGPDELFTICAPSSRECEEWNDDRKTVINKSLGPCVSMKTDEYRELK